MRQARSTRRYRRGVGTVICTTPALPVVVLTPAFILILGLTLALSLAITLTGGTILAANSVAELGPRHWAVGSLETLAKAGLLDQRSLPGGGSTGLTRLEIALVVSQALSQLSKASASTQDIHQRLDLSALIVAFNRAPATRKPLGPAEIEALRRLMVEFTPELAVFGIRVDNPGRLDIPGPASDVAASRFVDLDLLGNEASLDAAEKRPFEPGVGPFGRETGPELEAGIAVGVEAGIGAEPTSGVDHNGPDQSVPETSGDIGLSPTPTLPGGRGETPGLSDIDGRLRPEPVVNLENIENIGSLGSTSLLTTTSKGRSTELNGKVLVGEQVTIDSALVKDLVVTTTAEVKPGESRISAWRKVIVVEPTVKVSSEMASGLRSNSQAGAVEVQAAVQVGEVNLGANVRNVAGLKSAVALPQTVPDTQGYGLSLKLGKVTVLTGYENVPSENHNLRSIGVNYSFSQLATVKAGYEFVDVDAVTPKPRANAVLGVDFDMARLGKIRAGLTLEGAREEGSVLRDIDGQKASAGVELRLPWNARLTADYELHRQQAQGAQPNIQQTTTLGLGYNFAKNATLLLGYRLIDFGAAKEETDPKTQTDLTAGVSVRF